MALRSKCSFININKRSDRQGSVTKTGETKARQNHQQWQCSGRGRRQAGSKRQAANGQSRENSPGNNREIHLG